MPPPFGIRFAPKLTRLVWQADIQPELYGSIKRRYLTARVTWVKDYYFGGTGWIWGNVTRSGAPARVRLWLQNARTGQVLRDIWSDAATGAYAFSGLDPALVYAVIARDPIGQLGTQILDGLAADPLGQPLHARSFAFEPPVDPEAMPALPPDWWPVGVEYPPSTSTPQYAPAWWPSTWAWPPTSTTMPTAPPPWWPVGVEYPPVAGETGLYPPEIEPLWWPTWLDYPPTPALPSIAPPWWPDWMDWPPTNAMPPRAPYWWPDHVPYPPSPDQPEAAPYWWPAWLDWPPSAAAPTIVPPWWPEWLAWPPTQAQPIGRPDWWLTWLAWPPSHGTPPARPPWYPAWLDWPPPATEPALLPSNPPAWWPEHVVYPPSAALPASPPYWWPAGATWPPVPDGSMPATPPTWWPFEVPWPPGTMPSPPAAPNPSPWPANQWPPEPELEGYREQLQEASLTSDLDSGFSRRRPRFTAAVIRVECSWLLSPSQLLYWDGWWSTTLRHGAQPFAWLHPRLGAAMSARFVEPFERRRVSAAWWRVSAKLELLP
jgi:hypothetical protein